MKHLLDIINEDKIRYEKSEDFTERARKVFIELQKLLPAYSDYNGDKFHDGSFKFNEYDLTRYPVENAKYIGSADRLTVTLDTENNDINTDTIRSAFELIFKSTIKESLFDKNNIKKDMPEYEWVNGLYNGLSKFFGTKDFSKIHLTGNFYGETKSSIYKELEGLPTVEKEGLIFTFYGIDGFNGFRDNYEWNRLTMYIYVYERKDEEKVKAIKAQNDARKPLDIVGRELLSGDTVAYAILGGYGGYKGMMTGSITKVNKDMVEVDGHRLRADRCCLISRKDGKRIE